MSEQEPGHAVPEPGRDAAPDATSEHMDPSVEHDELAGTVTHREQSSVGPGTGENEVVKVTSPVQREADDETTSHPTLRDDG